MPTLIDKIWKRHVIRELSDGRTLLHIDRHLIHDGSSRQAFDGLRATFRTVRNPTLNFAVVDHIVSTLPGRTGESYPPGRERIRALRVNCIEFGLELYDVDSPRQGIVHVIAPELGIALPGCTLVCGDSHTATNGGLGALADSATNGKPIEAVSRPRIRHAGSLPATALLPGSGLGERSSECATAAGSAGDTPPGCTTSASGSPMGRSGAC